jgi:putative glutamine amidotransferase
VGINSGRPAIQCGPYQRTDPLLLKWIHNTYTAGGVPVVVPDVSIEGRLDELLGAVQGFVLAGEGDACNPCSDPDDTSADGVIPELLLIQALADRRIPFLGIGLGFQLLNIAMGGTIACLEHDTYGQPFHVHPHNPRHVLKPRAGSVMDAICGPRTVLVTSSHRYAIARVAQGLEATTVTDDGVIESLESTSQDWFAMGVQFQPDVDGSVDLAAALFDTFLDEVIAHAPAYSAQATPAAH